MTVDQLHTFKIIAGFDTAKEAETAKKQLQEQWKDGLDVQSLENKGEPADFSDGADVMGSRSHPDGDSVRVESEFENRTPDDTGLGSVMKRFFAIDNNPIRRPAKTQDPREKPQDSERPFQNSRNILTVTLSRQEDGEKIRRVLEKSGGIINQQASTWH